METFTWRGQVSTSGQGEFISFTTDFGDGYSQNIPNGIDNHKQSWTVIIKGSRAVVLAARDFIVARKGQSFIWRPPFSAAPGYFKCPRYQLSDEGAALPTLTLNFEKGNFIP